MKKNENQQEYFANTSLSGKPGILFGIFSILFIYLIAFLTNQYSSGKGVSMLPISFFEIFLIIIVLLFLVISYFTITLINKNRRKRIGIKGWEPKSKAIRKVFAVALILFCLSTFFIYKIGHIKYVLPLSLCFYGLACIVVKKLTSGLSNFLGLFFILQAFLCLLQPDIMFIIWGISFGLGHIIYGLFGKRIGKYPRKELVSS